MKKFLNKALLYKEWKTCKWYMLIFTLINFYFMININNVTGQLVARNAAGLTLERVFLNNYYSLWILTFMPLLVYASVLIGDEFSGKKYEIFTTMPFTREEIVINKWFMGIMSILIPFMISFVMFIVSFTLNKDILAEILSYKIIISWFVLNVLEYIFVFTFIILIQFLSGINFLGCIFGSIFLFLPLGLSAFLNISTRFLPYSSIGKGYGSIDLNSAAIKMSLVLYNVDFYKGNTAFLQVWLKLLILVLVTVICFLLAIYAFKKYSIENMGCIVAFKKLEVIFKLGTSICFGLLGSSIYSSYQTIPMSRAQADKCMAAAIMIALIVGVITYFITSKIIEANRQ